LYEATQIIVIVTFRLSAVIKHTGVAVSIHQYGMVMLLAMKM